MTTMFNHPDTISLLAVSTGDDPGEARRIQAVISNIDNEIAQAKHLLKDLIKKRSTLLGEATSIQNDDELKIREEILARCHLLARKQVEIDNTKAELVRLEERAYICSRHLSNPVLYEPDMSSPFCPPHTHHHHTEILRCQHALEQLLFDQHKIQQELDYHHKLIAPILRLPSELLEQIFIHCLPSEEFVTVSAEYAPLLVAGVSRHFRSLALATPRLWSSISIGRDSTGKAFRPHPSLIQLFLERSRTLPLSWCIQEEHAARLPIVDTNLGLIPLARVVEMFVPHYQRWKHVHIDYGSNWFASTGLTNLPPKARYPCLETLYVKRGYWLDQRDIEALANMLTSPILRGVSWFSQKPYNTLSFPWSQLKQFSLGHLIPLREAFHILSECKSLEQVEMTILLPMKITDNVQLEMFSHDKLRCLTVTVGGDLSVLFDNITLPNLRQLNLSVIPAAFPHQNHSDSYASLETIKAFVNRSQCVLEALAFEDIPLRAPEVLDILKFLSPSLRSLSLTHERCNAAYVDDKILRLLTVPDLHGSSLALEREYSRERPRGSFSPELESSHTPTSSQSPLSPSLSARPSIPDTPSTATSTDMDPMEIDLTEPLLCPNLRYLKLWGCIFSTDGLLADMVDSRWIGCPKCRPGQTLDVALIGLDDDMDKHTHKGDFARLNALKAARSGLFVQRLMRIRI